MVQEMLFAFFSPYFTLTNYISYQATKWMNSRMILGTENMLLFI